MERAPEYKANQWEHRVLDKDKNNTFYMTLPEGLEGKAIKLYAVFSDCSKAKNCTCDIYLAPIH